MRKQQTNSEELFEQSISGYHVYALDEPRHLLFASAHLCALLGCPKEELESETADLYEPLVHPADARVYRDFLADCGQREQTKSVQYRLLTRSGQVRQVVDTLVSRREPDGQMRGYSTLADVTGWQENGRALQIIRDTPPCGLLRYTCEKEPRVTWLNERMMEMLGLANGTGAERTQLEGFQKNIYQMIAPESRTRFARAMQQVFIREKPYAGEVTVLRADGSKRRLFGWITKTLTPAGEEEFSSIVMDVTDHAAAAGADMDAMSARPRVFIRTFGYFDVFVEDRPIVFRNEKAKELLALLVDRRGGYISSEEATAFLWENEPASALVLSRYRKVALRLKNQLEEYGVGDIIETVSGKRRIVPEHVSCDLFSWLSDEQSPQAQFRGSYLTNYSWGELTLGELTSRAQGMHPAAMSPR